MKHDMRLHPAPFAAIRDGKQLYEVRIYDEKRKLVRLGDIIVFSERPELKNTFEAEVSGLLQYRTFRELFTDLNVDHWNAHGWTIEQCVEPPPRPYTSEDEQKYGVVAIRVKV